MEDSITKKNRGFGFVTFADPAVATKIMQTGPHLLNGREVKITFITLKHSKHDCTWSFELSISYCTEAHSLHTKPLERTRTLKGTGMVVIIPCTAIDLL